MRVYAATKIQSLFRGFCARRLVRAKRTELENFIKFYRAMEADDVLSEYYNQNPMKRFFKNRETQANEKEAAVLRTTIAQARLLDDDEIRRRLGAMARKDPIPKYGNLRKTDKDKGKDKDHSDKSESRPKPHRKADADPLYANYWPPVRGDENSVIVNWQAGYGASEAVTISMTIRFDNAIQTPVGSGVGAIVGRTLGDVATGGGNGLV